MKRGTGASLLAGLALLSCAGCRIHFEDERFHRWFELSPPPVEGAIQRFRSQYPTTPVTTTQPNSWSKIEVGMTRGMVRALVGERLRDPPADVATLSQEPTPVQKWFVWLDFDEPLDDATRSRENDILTAIFVRRVVDRPIGATDWP